LKLWISTPGDPVHSELAARRKKLKMKKEEKKKKKTRKARIFFFLGIFVNWKRFFNTSNILKLKNIFYLYSIFAKFRYK
jgi:hypothetical protein